MRLEFDGRLFEASTSRVIVEVSSENAEQLAELILRSVRKIADLERGVKDTAMAWFRSGGPTVVGTLDARQKQQAFLDACAALDAAEKGQP